MFCHIQTQCSLFTLPNMLRDRLTGLADYLITNGPVIKDGDTLGEDKHEKIQAIYADSGFGYDGKVMSLNYTKTKVKKSFFKFW